MVINFGFWDSILAYVVLFIYYTWPAIVPIDVYISFIFQAAALLAIFTHPSHIVIYTPGDSFTCRRAATRNLLGI